MTDYLSIAAVSAVGILMMYNYIRVLRSRQRLREVEEKLEQEYSETTELVEQLGWMDEVSSEFQYVFGAFAILLNHHRKVIFVKDKHSHGIFRLTDVSEINFQRAPGSRTGKPVFAMRIVTAKPFESEFVIRFGYDEPLAKYWLEELTVAAMMSTQEDPDA